MQVGEERQVIGSGARQAAAVDAGIHHLDRIVHEYVVNAQERKTRRKGGQRPALPPAGKLHILQPLGKPSVGH